MSEETTPEETQDTSADETTAAPEGTPAPESTDSQAQSDSTNWQERYENLQPEYTRASQEAAQYRQIIALAQQGDPQAIEALGLSLADSEDDDLEDETQFHDPRVDQLLQAEQMRQYEAELDTLEQHVDTEIGKLAKSAGYEVSDVEKNLIFSALTPKANNPNDPDVEAAFKMVTGLRDEHISDYVAKKRRAPLAPSGSPSSHQPDLDDPEQRRQYWAEQAAALEA